MAGATVTIAFDDKTTRLLKETTAAMNSASEFVDQIKELKAAHDKTAASLKEAKEEIKELRFLLQGKASARI